MITGYDIGRARIDTLLREQKPEEALLVAHRLFPQQKQILSAALATGNIALFRDVCSIPEGSEWVNGQYLPGPFQGLPETGIQTIEISNPVPAPAPVPVIGAAQVVQAFMPLFAFVLCVGGLVVIILIIVVTAGSILSGLATGLTAAFAIIGECLAYAAALIAVVLGIIYILRTRNTETEITYEPYHPSARSENDGGINVTVNINSNNKNLK